MKKMNRILMLFGVIATICCLGGQLQAQTTDLVNINTATAEELQKLKAIGPTIAARIVEYRKANGPFKTPEDLMKVKGIGEKSFEKIKDQITVGKAAKSG